MDFQEFESFIVRCYRCLAPKFLVGPLKFCSGCKLATYCSKECQKEDRPIHKYACKEFAVVNGKNVFFTTGPWKEHIASIREWAAKLPVNDFIGLKALSYPRVCNNCHESNADKLAECRECWTVCYCSRRCAKADKAHASSCFIFGETQKQLSTKDMALSYPNSVLNALKFINPQTYKNDTLTVHIITSTPMLDMDIWEGVLLHSSFEIDLLDSTFSPEINKLNLVFVWQDRSYKPTLSSQKPMKHIMCKDCCDKKRSITYSIQNKLYHMYFSSLEYTEPNLVVIFGNIREVASNADYAIHRDISYRNMLQSPHTIMALFDETEELLKEGYKTIDALVPLYKIVKPTLNKFRSFTFNQPKLRSTDEPYNDKKYFMVFTSKGPVDEDTDINFNLSI